MALLCGCSAAHAVGFGGGQRLLSSQHVLAAESPPPAAAAVAAVPLDSVELCMQTAYSQTARIHCPPGMEVEGFRFASFGDPEASICGRYRLGACHVGHTRTILQNMCTGKPSCSIPVTNEFFGVPSHPGDGLDAHPVAKRNARDSCLKEAKSLAVEYRCVAVHTDTAVRAAYFSALKEFYITSDDDDGDGDGDGDDDDDADADAEEAAARRNAAAAAAAAARAAAGTNPGGPDDVTAKEEAAAATTTAEAWRASGWGTLHRCAWAGTPTAVETSWLTAGQRTNPSQRFLGRFRGRFIGDAPHAAAAGFLRGGREDVRDRSTHAALRPGNGTGPDERVRGLSFGVRGLSCGVLGLSCGVRLVGNWASGVHEWTVGGLFDEWTSGWCVRVQGAVRSSAHAHQHVWCGRRGELLCWC